MERNTIKTNPCLDLHLSAWSWITELREQISCKYCSWPFIRVPLKFDEEEICRKSVRRTDKISLFKNKLSRQMTCFVFKVSSVSRFDIKAFCKHDMQKLKKGEILYYFNSRVSIFSHYDKVAISTHPLSKIFFTAWHLTRHNQGTFFRLGGRRKHPGNKVEQITLTNGEEVWAMSASKQRKFRRRSIPKLVS